MLSAWILTTPMIWLLGIAFVKNKALTREKAAYHEVAFASTLLLVLPWWAIYFLVTSHWSCG